MTVSEAALEKALSFVTENIAPKAQLLDSDSDALRDVIAEMGKLDLLAVKRPMEYGGPDMDEVQFRTFQEQVARASGAFAFLQTQHQSAAKLISSSDNQELKQKYLPSMGDGRRQVGIGFSQLRRPGPPVLRSEKVEGGYVVNGTVPWATGWSLFPEIVIGSTLPDGRALFSVIPFGADPCIEVSPPMKLAAMMTALTVSMEIKDLFVPDEQVLYIRPIGWIAKSDMINVALQGHFAIGCALGALDVVETAGRRRNFTPVLEAYETLKKELEACRLRTAQAQRLEGEETTDERLAVRAWAIDIAFRCAQAAIVSNSGAANSLDHPAQRYYREALVYAVSAQTQPIMAATLARIVRPEFAPDQEIEGDLS